jgi:hypothetical protein
VHNCHQPASGQPQPTNPPQRQQHQRAQPPRPRRDDALQGVGRQGLQTRDKRRLLPHAAQGRLERTVARRRVPLAPRGVAGVQHQLRHALQLGQERGRHELARQGLAGVLCDGRVGSFGGARCEALVCRLPLLPPSLPDQQQNAAQPRPARTRDRVPQALRYPGGRRRRLAGGVGQRAGKVCVARLQRAVEHHLPVAERPLHRRQPRAALQERHAALQRLEGLQERGEVGGGAGGEGRGNAARRVDVLQQRVDLGLGGGDVALRRRERRRARVDRGRQGAQLAQGSAQDI